MSTWKGSTDRHAMLCHMATAIFATGHENVAASVEDALKIEDLVTKATSTDAGRFGPDVAREETDAADAALDPRPAYLRVGRFGSRRTPEHHQRVTYEVELSGVNPSTDEWEWHNIETTSRAVAEFYHEAGAADRLVPSPFRVP